jgi:hypothetical protein
MKWKKTHLEEFQSFMKFQDLWLKMFISCVQVSRLLEMQTPIYLQTLDCHPKYQTPSPGEFPAE